MGVMIPRRNLFLLLVASALVLTEISPTNGIKCHVCGGATDNSVGCLKPPEANEGSMECTAEQKSCKREVAGEIATVSCDTAEKEDCTNPDTVCVCLTDDCNSKPKCGCGEGGGGDGTGKGGSGGIKKDKLDSSQSALIPGAASTLMALMVATFTFMIQRSSF